MLDELGALHGALEQDAIASLYAMSDTMRAEE